jgi:hypothetical protein
MSHIILDERKVKKIITDYAKDRNFAEEGEVLGPVAIEVLDGNAIQIAIEILSQEELNAAAGDASGAQDAFDDSVIEPPAVIPFPPPSGPGQYNA